MDPYLILGVPRGCTREEVKGAFRSRVHLAHPDRGGDTVAFVQLCNAYRQILEESPRADEPIDARPAVPPEVRVPTAPRGAADPRENYVSWLRQVSRTHSRCPRVYWWTKHPNLARGILLGIIVFWGLLIVVLTWLFGPGLDSSPRSPRNL